MELPEHYEEERKKILGEEWQDFAVSLEKPRRGALRLNYLRGETLVESLSIPGKEEKVPWSDHGYYYHPEARPGKHPYHEAGAYYIQEPSAMLVAQVAGVRPGEKILDLCAAPGGKSTALGEALKGQGLLVSNEIDKKRCGILSQNIERMGIGNCVVTNETPERLAEHFPAFFQRIVVDAPCSGEGMFCKEPQALLQWTPGLVTECARRQREILKEAVKMLAPGGTLIYSTCTFAPEENEENVAWLLSQWPEFSLVTPTPTSPEVVPGNPKGSGNLSVPELEKTRRIWPHKGEGEGHFVAVLSKGGEEKEKSFPKKRISSKGGAPEEAALALARKFTENYLTCPLPEGVPVLFGEELYLLPRDISIDHLRVSRPGLHVGTCRKGNFFPSHGLAMWLKQEEGKETLDYPGDSQEIQKWLRGETLPSSKHGWVLITVDGLPLGWGKGDGKGMKNHYPKGLRRFQ